MSNLIKAIRFNYKADGLKDENLLTYWSALVTTVDLGNTELFEDLAKVLPFQPRSELYPLAIMVFNYTRELAAEFEKIALAAEIKLIEDSQP